MRTEWKERIPQRQLTFNCGGTGSEDVALDDDDQTGPNYMVTLRLPAWMDDRLIKIVKTTFSTGLLELCIPKTLDSSNVAESMGEGRAEQEQEG